MKTVSTSQVVGFAMIAFAGLMAGGAYVRHTNDVVATAAARARLQAEAQSVQADEAGKMLPPGQQSADTWHSSITPLAVQ